MSNLNEIRKEIDGIDNSIKELLEKRLSLADAASEAKRALGLPIRDTERERQIIARLTKNQDDETAEYTKALFNTLFDISLSRQLMESYIETDTANVIADAVAATPKLFPKSAVVACQGIEGSNSQRACERLFSRPDIMYFSSFNAVFSAVDKGLCQYGVLPVENSLYGSVTEVYDLMKKHKFNIARSARVRVNHALLARPGVKLEDIKEICSHKQALGQCGDFLERLSGVKITPCENTAVAARNVSKSERDDIAAISTESCSELYNLNILSTDIQNEENNQTLFICISKHMEIYPGADKMSVMFTVPHKPGSLYGVMSKFAVQGVNISKLESRPISDKSAAYMFYIDFEASPYSKEVINLIGRLGYELDFFAFLGGYCEV